ncbi:hypothetical protein AZ016_001446, partial [Klebsiella pneumoniae]
GAGHAGRQRPGHHRTRAGLRPVADVRAVRYAGKLHRKVGIAPGAAEASARSAFHPWRY